MVHIEGSIVICRPIEEVFAVAGDPSLEPRYNPIMASSEKVTPGPVRVGTRYRHVTKGFGGGETMVEVTQIDAPCSLRTRTTSDLMTWAGLKRYLEQAPAPAPAE